MQRNHATRALLLAVLTVLSVTVAPFGGSVAAADASGNVGVDADIVVDADEQDGDYSTISAALSNVNPGETIYIADGAYTPSHQLTLATEDVRIVGESESGVRIDTSDVDGYGFSVTASNVSLESFTLDGPDGDTNRAYGLKIQSTSSSHLTEIAVSDVTVTGSDKTEIDLNGVAGATLTDVTADGGDTGGAGIALTDSNNVDIDGVTTSGNTWGGIAVYSAGGHDVPAGSSDIRISNAHISESTPIYTQAHAASVTKLSLPSEYSHVAQFDDGANTHAYFTSQEAATAAAAGNGGVVTDLSSGAFVVDESMSIQAAVDAASSGDTVEILPGTYAESVVVGKSLSLVGAGSGETVIAPASGEAILVAGHTPDSGADSVGPVTISGLTVESASGSVGIGAWSETADADYDTESLTLTDVHVDGSDGLGLGLFSVGSLDLTGVAVENVSSDAQGAVELIGIGELSITDGTVRNNAIGVNLFTVDGYGANDGDAELDGNAFADNTVHVRDAVGAFDVDGFTSANDVDTAATVASTGTVYGDVQTALDEAPEGATVELSAGTHAVDLTVDRSVTISGADEGETVLVPESKNQSSIVALDASDVTIEGLTLDGDNPDVDSDWASGDVESDAGYGVMDYESDAAVDNFTLRNSELRNFQDYAVILYPDSGEPVSNHAIENNRIENVPTGLGVLVYNSAYATVAGNTMENVYVGVQTGNQHKAGGSGAAIVDNDISVAEDGAGIFHNLQYGQATNWTIADNDVTGGSTGILVYSIMGDRAAHLDGNTVEGADTGVYLWNTHESATVSLTDTTVRDATVGLEISDYHDYYGESNTNTSAVASDLTVEGAAESAVLVNDNQTNGVATKLFVGDSSLDAETTAVDSDGGFLSLYDSTLTAQIGVDATEDSTVAVSYSDLSGTDVAVDNADGGQVVAAYDYFGADGPTIGDTVGDVEVSPYLTAPPSEVSHDPSELTEFGLTTEFVGDGEGYAVAVPGPTEMTVSDMVGEFDGTIWRFDAAADEWTRVSDRDAEIDALDAFVLVPDEGEEVRVNVEFAEGDDAPAMPGERELSEGWNFVGAPQYGDAAVAFSASTASPARLVDSFDEPDAFGAGSFTKYTFGSYGPSPTVSPLTGYWVYANEDGTIAVNAQTEMTYTEYADLVGFEEEA